MDYMHSHTITNLNRPILMERYIFQLCNLNMFSIVEIQVVQFNPKLDN